MSRAITQKIVLASAMVTGLLLSGCSSEQDASQQADDVTSEAATGEVQDESQAPAVTENLEPSETNGSDSGQLDATEDVLAERDQFLEDQQLPLDGSPLSATTPEQQQFVEEQRTHVESQGGDWTPEAESLTLALTADACETAILNQHDVDATTVEIHIASSPLFLNQIPDHLTDAEKAQTEVGMADIMIYGMQHMCPADFPQWRDAVAELYPDFYGSQE